MTTEYGAGCELWLSRYNNAVAERDRLQRLFNRLDAAISHHKRDAEYLDIPEVHDERLWAARDRILQDSAKGKG